MSPKKTFEQLHPDLCPSKICGQVNTFENSAYVDGHLQVTEIWERDSDGKMVNVTARKALEEQANKLAELQAQLEKLNDELEKETIKYEQ